MTATQRETMLTTSRHAAQNQGDHEGPVSNREIIDALSLAIVVTDPTGIIWLWNAAAEDLYGWAEAEVLGRNVVDILAPLDDLDENLRQFDAVAAGQLASGDRLVVGRQGDPIRIYSVARPLVDPPGTVRAIIGASEDVTDLRVAEQKARYVADHFRLALEAGGLGTWRWDMATGETTWDERLEQIFGLPPGGFDGTFESYVGRMHPDDREGVLQVVRDAIEGGAPYRVDHRVVWPDGSVHWIVGAGAVDVNERGEVTGTIGCSMDITERVLQEQERQRLAAAATEHAAREQVQRERLEFLTAIHDALGSSRERHDLMVNVTRAAVPRLGDWCAIHVLTDVDGAVPEVEIAHVDPAMVAYARQLQERFPYDPGAPSGVAHVIRTRAVEFYPDISEEVITSLGANAEERAIIDQMALRSAITVPLIKGDRVHGAMQFVMSGSSRRYTDDDVTLAQAVAGRIASSLENRRLNDQQRVIADTLQRSLLPSSLPPIPGIDIAVRYWAAGEATVVGGDFYDVFEINETTWGLVTGDVCGTGPKAASLTGLARHTIRDSAWHGDNPIDVLDHLNQAVIRADVDSFCTAVYATITNDAEQIAFTVISGGHPHPVLVTSNSARTIGQNGTLLGVFPELSCEPVALGLDPGDVVVFYTDGATDIPPPHDVSVEQFTALVDRAVRPGSTAEAIADRIRGELDAIQAMDERDDDIALLVLRVSSG
jgi:PAS domain S-box-containing protein